MGKVKCIKCKKHKPFRYFYKEKQKVNGLRSWCMPCSDAQASRWRKENPGSVRGHALKARHGISLKEYEAKLAEQQGVCAICKKKETSLNYKSKKLNPLAVDHDHSNGQIRGLLCGTCNRSLGGFKDSPLLLSSALEYIFKWHNLLKII
jgi:Recombination endonuclease VII